MKTLILGGSPRPRGDTAGLIGIVRESLMGEVRVVDAYRCDVSPCVDCRYCWEHPGCAIDDGMGEIYDYIRDCGNILIASPIYFSELTGRLLDLGSRLQTYFCARHFRGEEPIPSPKRGAVILVGGGDGNMDKAYDTARTLLRHMGCREVHELVSAHDTNARPAVQDERAVEGARSIAAFFNSDDRFLSF